MKIDIGKTLEKEILKEFERLEDGMRIDVRFTVAREDANTISIMVDNRVLIIGELFEDKEVD